MTVWDRVGDRVRVRVWVWDRVWVRNRIVAAVSRDVDVFVTFAGMGPVSRRTEPLRLDPRTRLWETVND